MNWNKLQQQHIHYLSDALALLLEAELQPYTAIDSSKRGIYLLLVDQMPFYVGEANNLQSKIERQAAKVSEHKFDKSLSKNGFEDYTGFALDRLFIKTLEIDFACTEIVAAAMASMQLANPGKRDETLRVKPPKRTGLVDEVLKRKDKLLGQGASQLNNAKEEKFFQANPMHIAGVYQFWLNNELVFIGESNDMRGRIRSHRKDTYFSALRRRIGQQVFGFELKEKKGKKRAFSKQEDKTIDDYLALVKVQSLPVNIGRHDLETYLVAQHQPKLNATANAN